MGNIKGVGILVSRHTNTCKVAGMEGARHRGSAAAAVDGDRSSDCGKDSGGGGVALKKEIGLVSACGIIVGKSG